MIPDKVWTLLDKVEWLTFVDIVLHVIFLFHFYKYFLKILNYFTDFYKLEKKWKNDQYLFNRKNVKLLIFFCNFPVVFHYVRVFETKLTWNLICLKFLWFSCIFIFGMVIVPFLNCQLTTEKKN